MLSINESEKIYNSNLPIKYIFEKGYISQKYLIVVFSGFSSPNSEIQHSYNYIKTLKDVGHNKLFILDSYGDKGCYYIGRDMDFKIETSVLSLITYISRKYNINAKNIICVGSSKGGSSALYFGLKYNFGHVISGAPQTKIADYVLDKAKETANYLLGEEKDTKKIEDLNSIIYKQLDKEVLTQIHLLTSENDWQFNSHIKPLLDAAKDKEVFIDYDINNEMKNHNEIGKYFPNYLTNKLLEILYGIRIDGWDLFEEKGLVSIKLNIEKCDEDIINDDLYFVYILENKENKIEYKEKESKILFRVKEPDLYNISV